MKNNGETMAKNVIKTMEQFNEYYEKAKPRLGEKGLVCVIVPSKKGDIVLAKIVPRGERGLVFARVDPSIASEVLKKCNHTPEIERHVRKFKVGKNEFQKFEEFTSGKRKYAPAYLVKKILFTPDRGVKRPRTTTSE